MGKLIALIIPLLVIGIAVYYGSRLFKYVGRILDQYVIPRYFSRWKEQRYSTKRVNDVDFDISWSGSEDNIKIKEIGNNTYIGYLVSPDGFWNVVTDQDTDKPFKFEDKETARVETHILSVDMRKSDN